MTDCLYFDTTEKEWMHFGEKQQREVLKPKYLTLELCDEIQELVGDLCWSEPLLPLVILKYGHGL